MNYFFLIILFAVLVMVLGVGFFLDYWLRKKLNISRKPGVLYKPVHPVQGWMEAIIVIGSILLIFNVEFEKVGAGVMVPLVFTLQFSFRAVMEWKFERERREYIITASSVVLLVLLLPFVMALDYFM
ncbi:DUF4181 domain-containing protein [Mangrovibacillus sp. Mu-81]|uniref:DUF4181 domain-containing protein n=1 Tax=Mangrovibacillus sp. Mu-81 TaxID=3121478 RepID=UPI002FE439B8